MTVQEHVCNYAQALDPSLDPPWISCADTHSLDVPMLGEVVGLSYTKESY